MRFRPRLSTALLLTLCLPGAAACGSAGDVRGDGASKPVGDGGEPAEGSKQGPGDDPSGGKLVTDGATGGNKTASTVTPGPAAAVDPRRTAVVVVQHDGRSMSADLRVVSLADDEASLNVGEARGLHALSGAMDPLGHQVVATADPSGRWVVAEMAQMGGFKLRLSDGDASRFVPIGERRPSSLMLRGDLVYVGTGHEVGYVDLADERASFVSVRAREQLQQIGKAYDVLARDGDWLVAIDDEVMPLFADSFAIDAQGHLEHEEDFVMPGVINGHYVAAELRRDLDRGAHGRSGVLYTLTPYHISDGRGHDLAALPMKDGVSLYGAELTLNSTRREAPPVLEEHEFSEPGREDDLIAGDTFTPWTGLTRLGEQRLLVAAGTRGILAFPLDFTPDTRAEVIAIEGEALDVLASSDATGQVWVLARKEDQCRVELLRWQDGKLAPVASVDIEGECLRLLR